MSSMDLTIKDTEIWQSESSLLASDVWYFISLDREATSEGKIETKDLPVVPSRVLLLVHEAIKNGCYLKRGLFFFLNTSVQNGNANI